MDNLSSAAIFTLSGINESRTNKNIIFVVTLQGYFLTIFINFTLITIIFREKDLHQPIYIFLCNLCINGLYGTAGFYPKFLSDLLSDSHVISCFGCFLQTFVIFSYGLCEFTNLMVMAVDRYVAICRPLHYHMIMTPVTTTKLLVFIWSFPCCSVIFSILMTVRLPFCRLDIEKLYCNSWSLERLTCKQDFVNFVFNAIFMCLFSSLVSFVIFSYGKIFAACKQSKQNQSKFMHTCLPHLISFSNYAVVTLFDALNTRFGDIYFCPGLNNVISVAFIVIPPIMNPVIYGMKLRPIRTKLCKIFFKKKI